jgi:hypothetical protein
MRRCFTDPHYWKNPALRRSREKCLTKSGFLSTVISYLDILDGLIVKMLLTSIIINYQPIDVIVPEDIQQLTSVINHSPIDV